METRFGYICSDHFTPEDYHDYRMKVAGYTSDVVEEKCHSVKASCSNPTAAGICS